MSNPKTLYLDLLTVPSKKSFNDLNTNEQELWKWKSEKILPNESNFEKTYIENAGIYAEFGKIGGFAIGYESVKSNELKVKTFINQDEQLLLTEITDFLSTSFSAYKMCAHHGKEFDYPFLARRIIMNKIELPLPLKILRTKPWLHPHLDTMDLWKFGDRKSFTPLALLAHALGYKKLNLIGKGVIPNLYYQEQIKKLETILSEELQALHFVYQQLRKV